MNSLQELLYVVPFVAKVLESCTDSKVHTCNAATYAMYTFDAPNAIYCAMKRVTCTLYSTWCIILCDLVARVAGVSST